jgi:hypothetical protein
MEKARLPLGHWPIRQKQPYLWSDCRLLPNKASKQNLLQRVRSMPDAFHIINGAMEQSDLSIRETIIRIVEVG